MGPRGGEVEEWPPAPQADNASSSSNPAARGARAPGGRVSGQSVIFATRSRALSHDDSAAAPRQTVGGRRRLGDYGARGRSRTDTLLKAADFPATSAFAAPNHLRPGSWSGARHHHGPEGCRCPPSALYTFPRPVQGLGSASARSAKTPGPSPSLTGFTPEISSRGLKLLRLSPLRLPIPPLGHQLSVYGPSIRERYRTKRCRCDLFPTSCI